MARVRLSRRALLDVAAIETYSIEQWGDAVAAEYLKSIEDGLRLVSENPALLKTKAECPDSLCFYRIRQHILACALFDEEIFVLTVKHGAMDLPNRLAELEPKLAEEAQMLYQSHLKAKKKKGESQ